MDELHRRFLDALSKTERMSEDVLTAYQNSLLRPLLAHAWEQVPFYRERLATIRRADGSFDLERWRDIPVFRRADARRQVADLHAATVPPHAGGWSEGFTSGSLGLPFLHRRSHLADIASQCQIERDYDWYGIDGSATLATILVGWEDGGSYPEGSMRRGWSLRSAGDHAFLDIRTPVREQAEWLSRIRPRYLMTYPSNLRALAQHAVDNGTDLRIEVALTVGESISSDTRRAAVQAFGARVFDRYGAQEIGHMATECPDCGAYHVSAESVLIEILREDGKAAGPGERGELVVTAFYNYAMPFIRYAIGDHAEVAQNSCVRTLPSLSRILGRTRNMFRMRDGTCVWPDTRSGEIARFVPFVQLQIVQTSFEEVEVRYVDDGSRRAPDEAGLQSYFRAVIHPALKVRAVAVTEIARNASGKFEDYLSLVED